jgi:hypothetical protein
MEMLGRNYGNGEYRYGFNGKEKDDELKGEGNSLEMVDRWLDVRIGRMEKIDKKGMMFPGVSPYSFAMNSPLNAVDPDGKVVIFINGYHGFPTLACCGGKDEHWGKRWVNKVLGKIGDYKSLFFDGSLGGANGIPGPNSSLSPETRRNAGYNLGATQAANIINSLQRDDKGNIVESIKFVTSSMGTAYQRGFSQAIADYVAKENEAIDAYNASLPRDENGELMGPYIIKKRLNVTMEFTVDLDAYQGSDLSKDFNSSGNYFMLNDGGESNFVGSAIPGSTQIGLDEDGNTTMHGHHPSFADPNAFPKGNMNPVPVEEKADEK